MDTTQWPQGIGVVKAAEKKARPPKEQALSCPRCSSTNTKFCYYNNYSLTQPRYFCKACRRYWTEGGCLRNVPVGGGSRKHRRPSSNSSSPSPSTNPNPKIRHGRQDLNLAYNSSHYTANIGMSEYMALPFDPRNPNFTNSSALPVMELFKGIGSNPIYGNGDSSSGFHDFKMSLGFPAEGYNVNSTNLSRNIIFPFGETKQSQVSNGDQQFEMQGEAGNGGFWNGMITGGSSSW